MSSDIWEQMLNKYLDHIIHRLLFSGATWLFCTICSWFYILNSLPRPTYLHILFKKRNGKHKFAVSSVCLSVITSSCPWKTPTTASSVGPALSPASSAVPWQPLSQTSCLQGGGRKRHPHFKVWAQANKEIARMWSYLKIMEKSAPSFQPFRRFLLGSCEVYVAQGKAVDTWKSIDKIPLKYGSRL